jgi:hypothetical protein
VSASQRIQVMYADGAGVGHEFGAGDPECCRSIPVLASLGEFPAPLRDRELLGAVPGLDDETWCPGLQGWSARETWPGQCQ